MPGHYQILRPFLFCPSGTIVKCSTSRNKRCTNTKVFMSPDTCATQYQAALTNSNNVTTFVEPRSDDPPSFEDEGKLVIDESQMIDDINENNITRVLADNEVTTKDSPWDPEDTSMRIKSTGLKYNKPITLKHGNPADAHTIPSKKRLYPWRLATTL